MVKRLKVDDTYSCEFSFNQEDVINFANSSGDHNPIHLDSEFAKSTIYGRTIIHGFLGASVFSKVFGTIFPGEGTIYLKQDLSFVKPMFTNTKYTAHFVVIQTIVEKNRAIVDTYITDESDLPTIKGQAVIKHPSIY